MTVWKITILASVCTVRLDMGYAHGLNLRFPKDWRNYLLEGFKKPTGC